MNNSNISTLLHTSLASPLPSPEYGNPLPASLSESEQIWGTFSSIKISIVSLISYLKITMAWNKLKKLMKNSSASGSTEKYSDVFSRTVHLLLTYWEHLVPRHHGRYRDYNTLVQNLWFGEWGALEEFIDGDSEADVADEVDDDTGGVQADHADIPEALPHFIVTPCSTFCAVCKSGCKCWM